MILLLLAMIQMISILDLMIMMASNSMMVADLGIRNDQFGYLISAYTFGAGISGFMGVFFLDSFDRKKLLIALILGFLLAVVFSGSASGYTEFLIGRAISGAFNGALIALNLSIISDLVPEERRAAAIGFVSASFGVASVAGIPASMWLAMNYHWQAPFFAYGIVLAVLTVAIVFVIPKMTGHLGKNEKDENIFNALKVILTDSNMLWALLFTGLLVLGQFSIIPYIAGYMTSNVGYSNEDVTMMYFIGGLVTVVLSPLIGIWADKWGKGNVFVVIALACGIPFLMVTSMTYIPFWLSLMINSTFFIFISGRMIPATTMATSVVIPKYRGRFMSMRTAVQQFSISLGAAITGLITFTNENGELVNFEYCGYMAVGLTILAIGAGHKMKMIE